MVCSADSESAPVSSRKEGGETEPALCPEQGCAMGQDGGGKLTAVNHTTASGYA